jgi:hypothetical protein
MAEENVNANSETSPSARRGLLRRMVSRRPRFLPPEFHEHSRAARKEALLAMRSLIDARIERLEQTKEKPAPRKRTRKVKVE